MRTITERNRLVEENLKLVYWFVSRYWHRIEDSRLTHDDVRQEASIGLILAVERYDESRGSAFSTYAVWGMKIRYFNMLNSRKRASGGHKKAMLAVTTDKEPSEREFIQRALSFLTPTERDTLIDHFGIEGIPTSTEEIERIHALSNGQRRDIRGRALGKLQLWFKWGEVPQ